MPSKIESAAVKATLLNLGFVHERTEGGFFVHFSDESWLAISSQDALSFRQAACAVGRHYFRDVSFRKEAFRLSQSIIDAAEVFEDEQCVLASARKI